MPPHAHRAPLRPLPDPRRRPWGAGRFGRPDGGDPIGELWVAGPDSKVPDPEAPASTITLDALAAREGEALVGSAGMKLLGPRFPLLVKVLDPAEWLSLQLHPDDSQALEIAGPGRVGKREAWYVVEAGPTAELIVGTALGAAEDEVRAAIEAGDVDRRLLATIRPLQGAIIHVPPGTLHAIGPDVLLYEVQQPSDLTFRVSDWGRPPRADRPLHRAEVLRCIIPGSRAEILSPDEDEHVAPLVTDRFRLEVVSEETTLRPAGRTVEVVTVVGGSALLEGDGWLEALERWETLVVPAAVSAYRIRPAAGARVCVATLP